MKKRIGWVLVLGIVWGAAFAAGSLQTRLLKTALLEHAGLQVEELHLFCGGIVEAANGFWKRRGDEASFTYAHFGPRWMSLLDGQAPWELSVEAPSIHLQMSGRKLSWPRQRVDSLQQLLRWVSISFSHGSLQASITGDKKLNLEELRAASRADGSFRLEAPILYMSTPQGKWIGKDTVIETRGKRWERLQVSFVRVVSPQGVWLDAGGSVERVSSRVYAVDVYLRHADEHASFRGRVNLDEERFILEISFASSLASLLDYTDVFWPLGPAKHLLHGNVRGDARVVWQKRPVLADMRMEISDLIMAGEMFSTKTVQLPDILMEASARYTDGRLSISGKSDLQGPVLTFDAVWQPGETLKIEGSTNVRPCREWMEKGRSLLPDLEGMELDGTLGLRFGLWFDLQDPEKFNATADLSGDGCTVVRDAPNADPTQLMEPFTVHLKSRFGPDVMRRMDPSDPAFTPLAKIPPHTVAAFLIAEDRRFREHRGFDWPMILRAAGYNLKHRGFLKGASSISQQLVKNLYLSSTRSISRKLEEAILTWRMEQVLPKNRILELYLNIIEMGPGLYGIADGARTYFQREVRNLIPVESAHLALVTPAPTFRFHALRRKAIPDEWNAQVFSLLRKMLASGAITQEDLQAARERGLILQDY